jgi:quinol monooxygenase YgiN
MIIVQAKAVPKDESAYSKVIEAAQNLINESKAEEGNIDYNLYSNTGDGSLLFVEEWETVEILNKHLNTDHFKQFGADIDGLLVSDLDITVFNADKIEL